jgi:hypothetical protein
LATLAGILCGGAQAGDAGRPESRRASVRPWRAALVGAVVLGLSAAGCGGGGSSNSSAGRTTAARRSTTKATHPLPPPSVLLAYRPLYALSAPLRDPATAALGGGRFAMLGGLDAADVSSAGIEVADLSRVLHTGSLPGPQHDAQAANLGGRVYVFGGGYTTELDHILSYDPVGGGVQQVGALLAPQSDVAVAQSGPNAYVVGGFDGTNYLDTIVAWHPGSQPQVVAHLPDGLRYAAVAVADGGLLVLGGSTPAGASTAIYRFDIADHQVRRIGTLPQPLTHGGAATLGSTVYLVGGRGDDLNAQTRAVWAIDPVTGRVKAAGHLPTPTSDAAVVAVGGAIVVAGGQSPTATLGGVGELVPAGAG